MSRIGNKPISIPKGVEVQHSGRTVTVKGPKANKPMSWAYPEGITVEVGDSEIVVTRPDDSKKQRANHGLTRALINNMVVGASTGFSKQLLIYGVGYQCSVQGNTFVMKIGFCEDVVMPIPDGVAVEIKTPAARGNETPAEFTVSGPDKQVVGQFAAEIRRVRPPEPYKGKGIRYKEEYVARKEGKPLVSGG